jgi:hypothetical protein
MKEMKNDYRTWEQQDGTMIPIILFIITTSSQILREHMIIINTNKINDEQHGNCSIISSKILSSFLNVVNHNMERQRAMWHT